MVMFQAARTIAELRDVSVRELAPAITVLHLFLSSARPVVRFAAVRILNAVSVNHPTAVTNCNIELEQLMLDTNRSIAVYAITTLLKTGSESSVERLLKQIRTFMADIADDFKVVVVQVRRETLHGVAAQGIPDPTHSCFIASNLVPLQPVCCMRNGARCMSMLQPVLPSSALWCAGNQGAVPQVSPQAPGAAELPLPHAPRRGRPRIQARNRGGNRDAHPAD
jgi:hypothetical protein